MAGRMGASMWRRVTPHPFLIHTRSLNSSLRQLRQESAPDRSLIEGQELGQNVMRVRVLTCRMRGSTGKAGYLRDAACCPQLRELCHTYAGDDTYVRVQVLPNAGALDRDKQLAVVSHLTQIIAQVPSDPAMAEWT